jgi:hypothetical protein
VNRIFEGTNEINRLLIPGMLARRAVKGELPLIAAARRLQDELLSSSPFGSAASGVGLDDEQQTIAALKKVGLMVLGTAMQTYSDTLADEQEVLGYAADIVMDAYAAESSLLRSRFAIESRADNAAMHQSVARLIINDASLRIEQAARNALAAMAQGDTLRTLLAALRRFLKVSPINTVELRRLLARATVEKQRYIFS